MSQTPNSSDRIGGSEAPMPAVSKYQDLVASGAFEPSTTVNGERPYAYTPRPAAYAPAATAPNAYSSRLPVGAAAPGNSAMYAPTSDEPYPPHPAFQDVHTHSVMHSKVSGRIPGQSPYMGAPTAQYRPILAHAGITQQMISTRVQEMLHLKLPSWAPRAIVLLGVHLSHTIIARGQANLLGPYGLTTLDDLYMVVGYEGTKRYMALAVNAPGRLDILIKGAAVEAENRDALVNERFMEELRLGFYSVATNEWQRLDWLIKQSAGR